MTADFVAQGTEMACAATSTVVIFVLEHGLHCGC